MKLACLFIALLFFSATSFSAEMEKIVQKGVEDGVTVDLREPHYSGGVLSTDKGGVITASQIRIQAMNLRYTKKKEGENLIWTIEGEGDLIVEFGEYVFVGEKLSYDFNTRQGVIYKGRTAIEPWFFGGEQLELRADGSYVITNGYVTTSEKDVPDWGIYSDKVVVEEENYVRAQKVNVNVSHYTILWLPAFRANLNSIFDNPIRYRFRWGGRQGPRFGLTYEVFSWKHWRTSVRFDYRVTRGPGGGIETHYRSEDRKTEFQSINYIAKDSSILHPHEKARFRFEGSFKKLMDNDKTSILLTYDKISDKDMPGSYYDRDFDFDTAERTQLLIRRQEQQWISNFYTRVRLNSFQTVKQELPTFETSFKPFELPQTGIIFENKASASFLNFEYSKYIEHAHNYSSTRFQYFPTLYRPIPIGPYFTFTPEVGMEAIVYGSTPKDNDYYMFQGRTGFGLETQLYRLYGNVKHIIEPYATYRYYSSPTSSPHQHYIFDVSDGWTRLNYLSFGINNAFYRKSGEVTQRILSADIYSYAFFDSRKVGWTVPRVFGNISCFVLPTLKHSLDVGWNLEFHEIDYVNYRIEWTVNDDLAIAAEYRNRGSYWWRKVDTENFFVDVFHSEERLKHSSLSDRSETMLYHCFYRFHPNWACQLISRQGWHRRNEPSYWEFEFDVLTTIQSAWNLRFSYQHQENDDRVAMYLNVGLKRPSLDGRTKKTIRYE